MKTIVEHLSEAFSAFSPELRIAISKSGRLKHLEPGDELMSVGGHFKVIPLITKGAVKVMREDELGNELFLYYLRPGQTCALSLNCLMMDKPSEVHAVADEETTLISLNVEDVQRWMLEHESWRTFVMSTFQMRFHEMLATIDGIAFKKLDERVLDFIRETTKVYKQLTISMTHQEIANQLNSTREVISRILKILEKQGKIELGRNRITLL